MLYITNYEMELRMMKKALCILTAFLICVSLAVPAFAATNTFVPSISYKDHPDADDFELCDPDGNKIEPIAGECLIITSIQDALNGTDTGISEEARQTLLDLYEQLEDGSMKLPYKEDAEDMVIRDLFDASVYCDDAHREELKKPGVCIKLTFDLGIAPGVDAVVMVYVDGQWVYAESVVNNGDGTITVVLEDICPIAISVKNGDEDAAPPKTGDQFGQNLGIWITVMAVSAVAVAVLLIVYFKKRKVTE